MFFSQTVRRDDEDDKSDVIGRALGAGRDSFDQRIGRATEGSENDDPLRRLRPVTSRSLLKPQKRSVRERRAIDWQTNISHPRPLPFCGSHRVGITLAWQSYREEAKEVVRTWVPSLGWVLPPTVKLAASAEASPELGQQLKPIALDLALVRRSVEQLAGDLKQLAAKQEQMAQSLATLQAVEQDLRQNISSVPPPGAVPIPRPKPTHPQRSHRLCSELSTGGTLASRCPRAVLLGAKPCSMSWQLEKRSPLRHPGLAHAVHDALVLLQVGRIIARRGEIETANGERGIKPQSGLGFSLRLL